jgi:hypothetical protein
VVTKFSRHSGIRGFMGQRKPKRRDRRRGQHSQQTIFEAHLLLALRSSDSCIADQHSSPKKYSGFGASATAKNRPNQKLRFLIFESSMTSFVGCAGANYFHLHFFECVAEHRFLDVACRVLQPANNATSCNHFCIVQAEAVFSCIGIFSRCLKLFRVKIIGSASRQSKAGVFGASFCFRFSTILVLDHPSFFSRAWMHRQ